MIGRLALLMIALMTTGLAHAQGPEPFVRGSYQAIAAEHQGRPFVLVLWSLDCVYCRHDLAMLGRLKVEYPALELVVVATDTPERRDEIPEVLERLQLGDEPSWIFADSFVERLRFEIDPQWFGELPRTYFFDGDGNRIGVSGKLNEQAVEEWIRADL